MKLQEYLKVYVFETDSNNFNQTFDIKIFYVWQSCDLLESDFISNTAECW